ncbi:MAG: HEAT repeat domain-containing protein [Planctomycetes bacterium]|nr:HEAT repeat domain-containing protein [Planctomycetota bacterium]
MSDVDEPKAESQAPEAPPTPSDQPDASSPGGGMDDATNQLVSDTLQQMRVALQNIRLYPEGSPQALRAAGSVFEPVSQLLAGRKSMVFGMKDGKFLVDGDLFRPVDDRAAGAVQRFAKLLTDSAISSMTFVSGLTTGELGIFLDGFSRKKWTKESVRRVADELRQQGVTHILLNEQVYVAVDESDAVFVVEKGGPMLDQDGVAREKILKALNDVTRMVGEIQDDTVRGDVHMEIAKRIIELDPEMLPKLLKDPELCKLAGDADVGSQIEGLTDEDVKEIVVDVIRLYNEIRSGAFDTAAPDGELAKMRALVDRILLRWQDRGVSTDVFEEMLNDETLNAASAEKGGAPKSDLSEMAVRIEEMLEKDPLFILRDDQREGMDAMVRDLDMEEQGNVMTRLLAQLIQALRSPKDDIRLKAVRRIVELQNVLESINDRELVKVLDATMVEMMDGESSHRVYREAGQLCRSALSRAIVEQDYKQAVHVVTMLRRHTQEAGEGFQQRAEEANSILAKFTDREIVGLFIAELFSEYKEASHAARDILVKLGPDGVPAIVAELKEMGDRSHRFMLADVIRAIGPEAVARLVAEVERESNTEVAGRLLEVATRVGQEEQVLTALESMLHRASPEGRLAVVRALSHMAGDKSVELVCQAMRDSNPYVATEAIRVVEQSPNEKAAPVLTELVRGTPGLTREQSEQIKEAACRALGIVGDLPAVQCLLEVAQGPGLVDRLLGRGHASEVRCAAMAALARFRNQSEVVLVLQSLLNDGDAHVRDTAKWCLES